MAKEREAAEPKKNVGRKPANKKNNATQGISIPMSLNCDGSPADILPLFAEMVKLLIEKDLSNKRARKGVGKRAAKSRADLPVDKQSQEDIVEPGSDESEATESGDGEDPPAELSDPSTKTGPAKARKGRPGPLRRRNTGVRYTPYLSHSARSSSTGLRGDNPNSGITPKPASARPVSMLTGDTFSQSVSSLDSRIVKFLSAQQAALEALLVVRAGIGEKSPNSASQIPYNFQAAWNEAVQQHHLEEPVSVIQLQMPKQKQQQQQQQQKQQLRGLQELQQLQQELQLQQQKKQLHQQEQQQLQQQYLQDLQDLQQLQHMQQELQQQQQKKQLQQQYQLQQQQQLLQREQQQHLHDLQDLLHLQQFHQEMQQQQKEQQEQPLQQHHQMQELTNDASESQSTTNDALSDSEVDNLGESTPSGISLQAMEMLGVSSSLMPEEPSAAGSTESADVWHLHPASR